MSAEVGDALQPLVRLAVRLSDPYRELRKCIEQLEDVAGRSHHEIAITWSRKALEFVVQDLFGRRIGKPSKSITLDEMLKQLGQGGFLPAMIENHANGVRSGGNVGAHRHGAAVTAVDVGVVLTQLFRVLHWYFESEQPDGLAPAPAEPVAAPDPVPDPPPVDIREEFAASIRKHLATLDRAVERLTGEQLATLRMFEQNRRVRVAGCAGSGKTLVAAEKASRLAASGQRVLFLCHNPMLAEHVRGLMLDSGVQVESFGEWVAGLVGGAHERQSSWTHSYEPDQETLTAAFDALAVCGGWFNAVIVDEGQDFRSDWWTLVEAALAEGAKGTLYIFHDDLQALLPYRSAYPFESPVINLSRNCRNAGKVHLLVRSCHPKAPPGEQHLKDLGETHIIDYARGGAVQAVRQAVRWLDRLGVRDSFVALEAGVTAPGLSPFADPVALGDGAGWQDEVRQQFRLAVRQATTLRLPPGGEREIADRLSRLSADPVPSAADVQLVRDLAGAFRVHWDTRRRIMSEPQGRTPMMWKARDGGLMLWKPGRTMMASEIIMHFDRDDWHAGIPEPPTLRFARRAAVGTTPVYRIGDFKGLEANAALLHIGAMTPVAKEEVYVGVSRARMILAVVIDQQAKHSLPTGFRRALQG